MIRKVGILTWHYYSNFGSQLQAHALTKIIRELGFSCRTINYRNPKYGKPSAIKNRFHNVLCRFPESIIRRIAPRYILPHIRFRKYLHETKLAYTEDDLVNQSKQFDAIICGSDQIWAPNVYNPIYMLNFVGEGVRKLSYAASIGLNEIPQNLVPKYKEHLSTFDSISVREQKGKELLHSLCDIDSTVVLDPTLMVNAQYWDSISKIPDITGEYIFCYLLNKNHNYTKIIKGYSIRTGIPIYAISANDDDYSWAHRLKLEKTGPKEFLGLIKNAHTIITDSYHGTIFSLLFHKRYLTLERFVDSDKICQNSRIIQLDSYFGISDHIVKSDELNSSDLKLELIPITDWDIFEQRLAKLRKQSKLFLENSLH